MKLSSAPQHEAILSNVGEVGEFRIRNSAKAFSILSSGLYSNKIRAIIRELSCNAVDSHVAANRNTTPFDVHLPNAMEPWFAIRDYGVGLSYDQVVNIYTTAFSPDKNKVNDIFRPVGAELTNIKEFKMTITDKSGNELFNTIDYIKGWDGLKSNGDPYENGFYFYEMWFKYNDKTEERVVGIVEIALNGW